MFCCLLSGKWVCCVYMNVFLFLRTVSSWSGICMAWVKPEIILLDELSNCKSQYVLPQKGTKSIGRINSSFLKGKSTLSTATMKESFWILLICWNKIWCSLPKAEKFKTQRGNFRQWIFNSQASSHTQKHEQGLIFSTKHTGYFHSHVLSRNCWPKERRHFRYLGVTWHDLTALQFPSPLGRKHQNMLQWILLSAGLTYARGQFVQWCVTAFEQCGTGCAKTSFHKAQINPIPERHWRKGRGPGANYVTFLCHNLKEKGLGETFTLDHR